VVDDHLMEITHVARGQEYLSSAPKYNLLYQAFGWEVPEYLHLPLIVKADGSKLSKRKGDPTFEDLVKMGFLPEAIVNYVALLGWNPGTEQELFTLEGLIEAFDMKRINKAPAAYSLEKLTWLNSEHIRAMTPEAFHALALRYYPESIQKLDRVKISRLIQIRTEKLTDITEMVSFLASLSSYSVDLFANEKSKSTLSSSKEVLEQVIPILETLEDWTNEQLFVVLKEYAQNHAVKVGTVMWPIRTSLSGLPNTPGGATELADLLGKRESIHRLKRGLAKLLVSGMNMHLESIKPTG
jgi:glutamyl-tRNA synthetase